MKHLVFYDKTSFSAIKYLLFTVAFLFFSCSKQDDVESSYEDELRHHFQNTPNQTSLQGMDVLADWNGRFVNEGVFYVPLLIRGGQLDVWLNDSTAYSLLDKTWLKAHKTGGGWTIKLMTLYPDDLTDWSVSGVVFFENWADGKTSHVHYVDNKVFRSENESIEMLKKVSANRKTALRLVEKCVTRRVRACVEGVCHWRETTSCSEKLVEGTSEGGFPPAITGGRAGNDGSENNIRKALSSFNNNRIDDSELPPCIRGVLRGIKELKGNSVADIIHRFAGEVPGYNWKIKTENLSSTTSMDLDQYGLTLLSCAKPKGEVTTFLNPDHIQYQYASDLAIATTIVHEIHTRLFDCFVFCRLIGGIGNVSRDAKSFYKNT